ncbi:unnamed protein product [Wuchereria bancrofti]|uniref:Methionine synthase reductase n=1 Tax=Wuchereria bancrofti TaxID=6293 RepID=A0A3P7ES69_WUCBA|nr:unnamed protein product [Wuchereria bancrofti]
MDIYRIQQLCLEEKKDCKEGSNGILKSLEVHPPTWPENVACLIRGAQKLQDDSQLRVPVARDSYLNCKITSEEYNTDDLPWQNGCRVVGALNERYRGRVVNVSNLTSLEIQKPKQEIVVDLEHDAEIFYEPGDAFYFVVPNIREEVDFILERIGFLEAANRKLVVTVKSQNAVKNTALPPYIPEVSTLRYIFTWCLDIRRSPGRPLLRVLAECTESECQKRRILELCSAQGVEEFTKFVRQAGLSLVDFLLNFPSCRPTVERLIELLPRLLPRPYSVTCIRELWGKRTRFIFSLLHFTAAEGRCFHRFGLSSGWLATLKKGQQVMMFLKESSRFRLPPPVHSSFDLVRTPLIMDIMRCVDENILSHVSLCESQPYDISSKKYVQDALQERGEKISNILSRKNEDENHPAIIFVCGSSKQMLKHVADVFVHIFSEFLHKSKEEAELYLRELRINDRYVEDIW